MMKLTNTTYLTGAASSLRSRMVGVPALLAQGRTSQRDFARIATLVLGFTPAALHAVR